MMTKVYYQGPTVIQKLIQSFKLQIETIMSIRIQPRNLDIVEKTTEKLPYH